MDHDVVSMDLLDGLKKFLPEKEECEKITMYQEAPETEQKQMGVMNPLTAYMSEGIVGVKWLNNRMDCIRIQHEAIRFCNEAIDDLSVMTQACDEVLNSDLLKQTLCICLSIGNGLNAGTSRGSALGFRVSGCTDIDKREPVSRLADNKLARVKSDGGVGPNEGQVRLGGNTVLHFWAMVLRKHDVNLALLKDELRTVERACDLRIADIETRLKTLQKDLKTVEKMAGAPEDTCGDSTYPKLSAFLENQFRGKLKEVQQEFESTLGSATKLLKAFGEDLENSDLFVGIWFCRLMCVITTLQVKPRSVRVCVCIHSSPRSHDFIPTP